MASQRLALAGVLAPVVFVGGVVIAGLTWPDYRHTIQNISDLGGMEAPFAAVQNATFVVFGLLVAALAFALRRGGVGAVTAGAVPPLIGGFGAMVAVQGLTPCTPGCAGGTPVDLVHVLTALSDSSPSSRPCWSPGAGLDATRDGGSTARIPGGPPP